MTLQEILKAKGLSPEDVEAVIGEMKQNKIFTSSHENMDQRYPKLKADFEGLTTQHGEATKLIEQFKAGAKDNEALQGKIAGYEKTISDLTAQLQQSRLDAAVKIALLDAKVTDVDYMTFKLKEKGELELDEQGNIKGIEDKLAGLKTQLPDFFGGAEKQLEVQPHKLPDRNNDRGATVTKEDFNKMGYNARVELKQSNPAAYEQLTKG